MALVVFEASLVKKHFLSSIDPAKQIANCAFCGTGVSVRFRRSTGFWVCRKQDTRKNHKGSWLASRERLAAAQGNRCAICQKGDEALVLDHCHKTGKHRAALCRYCNVGIGMFKEDPELLAKAIEYLNKHKTTVVD